MIKLLTSFWLIVVICLGAPIGKANSRDSELKERLEASDRMLSALASLIGTNKEKLRSEGYLDKLIGIGQTREVVETRVLALVCKRKSNLQVRISLENSVTTLRVGERMDTRNGSFETIAWLFLDFDGAGVLTKISTSVSQGESEPHKPTGEDQRAKEE